MTSEEIKYCKYCNNELKKITYEIIDPDKTGEFERLYCKKCPRMFYFRDLTQRKAKKTTEKKEKKTEWRNSGKV